MSRNISSFFVASGIIPEDDREVYIYSFEILLATLVNFIALIFLSIVSQTMLETVFFLLGFVPLRQVAGGYHAKNHLRCFLILLFSYAVFLLLLYFLPTRLMLPALTVNVIFSIALVFAFAPSEDENKPLSNEETARFKKKSRLTIAFYATVIGLFAALVSDKPFAFSLSLGMFTVAVSVLANHIKYAFGANKKYHREQKPAKPAKGCQALK